MGDYSSGDVAALPSGVDNLEHVYDGTDLAAVATEGDSNFVSQTATVPEIPVHQYKDTATGTTVDITWIGQSDQNCADYPATLQVYKFSTTSWEDLATNNTQTANNNFTLQKLGQATTGYVDGSNVLTCRVYQTAAPGGPTIMDSYVEANYSSTERVDSTQIRGSQSFTGNGKSITSAKMYLKQDGSPTGNMTYEIWAHTGTYGVDGCPTGASALGTSTTKDVTTLPLTYELIELTFSPSVDTVDGTNYCLVLHFEGGNGTNTVNVGVDDTSPSHGGNWALYADQWYKYSGKDAIFYVYGE